MSWRWFADAHTNPPHHRNTLSPSLDGALKKANLKVGAPVRKAILSALAERDETDEICRGDDGQPEPDPELRDTENVPLTQEIGNYFDREVKPHVPDAWINTSVRDHQDGEIGKVATRSISTATSTSISRPVRWPRSGRRSRRWRRTSWKCCGKWPDENDSPIPVRFPPFRVCRPEHATA